MTQCIDIMSIFSAVHMYVSTLQNAKTIFVIVYIIQKVYVLNKLSKKSTILNELSLTRHRNKQKKNQKQDTI